MLSFEETGRFRGKAPVVLILSSRFTTKPSGGHFHWVHTALRKRLIAEGVETLVIHGNASENLVDTEFIALPRRTRYQGFWLPGFGLSRDAKYLAERLLDLFPDRDLFFHIYEGGIYELLLLRQLLGKLDRSFAHFNFYDADAWPAILHSPRLRDRRLRSWLGSSLEELQPRVLFSAETEALRRLIAESPELESIKLEIFPVFSSLDERQIHELEPKFIADVLVIARDDSELAVSLQTVQLIQDAEPTISFAALLPPELSRSVDKDLHNSFRRIEVGPLDSLDYLNLLGGCRFSIYPYTREWYRYGSSGRINDSLLAGSFPLVPRGTAEALRLGDFHAFSVPLGATEAHYLARRILNKTKEINNGIAVSDAVHWLIERFGELQKRDLELPIKKQSNHGFYFYLPPWWRKKVNSGLGAALKTVFKIKPW